MSAPDQLPPGATKQVLVIWRQRLATDFPELPCGRGEESDVFEVFYSLGRYFQQALRAGNTSDARKVIDFCLWGWRNADLQEFFLYNLEYFFDPVLESEKLRLPFWQLLADREFDDLLRFFANGGQRRQWLTQDLEREFRSRPRPRVRWNGRPKP